MKDVNLFKMIGKCIKEYRLKKKAYKIYASISESNFTRKSYMDMIAVLEQRGIFDVQIEVRHSDGTLVTISRRSNPKREDMVQRFNRNNPAPKYEDFV